MVLLKQLFNLSIALPAGKEMIENTKAIQNVLKINISHTEYMATTIDQKYNKRR
jgi:hypothetical protein